MEEQTRLVAAGNLLEAHTWKGMLEASGIQVELKGEALLGGVGELPTGIQNVELWVADSQYESAKKQMASLNAQCPKWKCVNCHEINESSFELCWNCSAERSEKYS
ncbi:MULTISPECIES: DUF2007 domain-containing protein [unclassified Shewanella]|uniref:putative signal transducing protein n=1 Tax=unclassified Shewanella TaxID=196818 RepID=UPI001BC2A9EC|nr:MULTISPECIES: DUF2007 domain-containing protein [unclassified Shewanella]GIU15527.1 zinc-finger-like domain-containing protein [Shewanella sp. MBTL60-112-B1]GIU34998.1 zinc-finger-like domain-containing protein [Shewanella sp. MBTL60-112-B2]